MTEAVSWLGRELELEVGAVAHGGHCVSRVDGRVVFVRHALPGERVTATVTEDKGGSFCRADAVTVHEASSGRVEPPCPVAVPGGCGGCDWQHADPALQRELKAAVVEEQLHRLAGIERKVLVEELPGGPLGWRTRVRLVAGRDGRAGLREHRSHRVVPIDDCPITVRGALDGVLSETWRPGSEIEVTRDADSEVHVREQNTWRGRTRSHRISGGEAVQRAAGREWRLDAHGFWQVHPEAAETFAALVGEWADAPRDGVAWDLYAGVGLFASVLAEQVGPGGRVRAIESGRRAVADGEANLADLPQVKWSSGRVEHVVARAEKPVDVVVLDPPRKGAGREVVDAIAAGEPDRIVYVACDPAALARDLAFFAGHGYGLTELRAFDAFPMTHHVECVALLQ
ncbi:class I SAM-dependent RNA methyltransferase [Amycolatopsis sp. CA-230715]|uniref:class I SAM-dependent RNA methyltransferase n=1 Tax=Amycolatopsis sp. CA-230715 TaxID=2745196 RepID=UPI001C022E0E|nr:class I SAM-dependent RNA methyltransferase [Amycolatopsis sp. CA-230715]QWF83603.1 23S rRNA (uracil-C(5))-methyltransferase RlmCD [Amycolatopsis sp. CA-230715]